MSTAELSKWIKYLFYLAIAIFIVGLFTSDDHESTVSITFDIVGLLSTGLNVAYLVILFMLGKYEKNYKTSAWLRIITVGISLLMIVFAKSAVVQDSLFGIMGVVLTFWIITVAITLASDYYEFKAHSVIISPYDVVLANKWKRLWTYDLIGIAILMLGVIMIMPMPLVAAMITLVASIIVIVVSILKIIYIYKTSNILNTAEEIERYTEM